MEPKPSSQQILPGQYEAQMELKAQPGLSPAQLIAVETLLAGHAIVDSAIAAHVSRSTLHEWLRKDRISHANSPVVHHG